MRKSSLPALLVFAHIAFAAHAGTPPPFQLAANPSSVGKADAAAVKYTCPMHPQIISDTPGKCPICGMDLVPLERHDHGAQLQGAPVITISAETTQKMGVRTEKVRRVANRLYIPRNAILRTAGGEHVIVALGEGKFQPREIKTGVRGNKTEIVSGLKSGEEVVTSGEFLIDSEFNLNKLAGGK